MEASGIVGWVVVSQHGCFVEVEDLRVWMPVVFQQERTIGFARLWFLRLGLGFAVRFVLSGTTAVQENSLWMLKSCSLIFQNNMLFLVDLFG